jgi:radical SAM protein with 4Fe4S-binding SPASM domain
LGERIEEARQQFPKLYISYSGNLAESLPADPAGRQSKPASLLSCSAGNTACAIDACGWVLPCTMMPHLRVGNVLQEDFADIWHHSPVLEQIRALRSVTIDQVPFCRDCRYVSVCNGGCRGTAYNKFRDLLAPDPDCPFADAYAASASSGGSLVQLGGAQTKTAVPEFAPAPAGVAAAPPRIGRRCTDDFGRSGPAVAIPNRGSATAVSHKAEVSWLEAGRGRSNFQRQGL